MLRARVCVVILVTRFWGRSSVTMIATRGTRVLGGRAFSVTLKVTFMAYWIVSSVMVFCVSGIRARMVRFMFSRREKALSGKTFCI